MSFNQYDLQNTSLVKTSGLTEMYIPLWYYSSSYIQANVPLGSYFIPKGSTNITQTIGSTVKLHTLSSNWSANQKFAFEASIWGSVSGTFTLELWDMTTNSAVTSSQVSTTNTTATVVRSGQFTLTPGHVYGISPGASTGYCNITKASLVAIIGG